MNFFFIVFVFVTFSVLIYSIGKLDLSFYVNELILLIAFSMIEYFQIVPKGNIINNTAVNVVILDNEIVITTAPFKVLFLIATFNYR